MNLAQTPSLSPGRPGSRWICAAAGALTALLSAAVLFGWLLDIPALKSVQPGWVSMKFNTALAFFLAGTSLWLPSQNVRQTSRAIIFARGLAHSAAGAVLLLGLVTLSQYPFNLNLGIDEILIADDPNSVATSHPGRMAPNTALAFVFIGGALLVLGNPRSQRPRLTAAAVLALLAVVLGLFAVGGYVANIPSAYGWGAVTGMALPTGLLFLILGAGTLTEAWLRSGTRWTIPGWHSLGLILGLLTLVGLSLASFKSATQLVQTANALRRSEEIDSRLRDLFGVVVDIQATVRGFVLTGQPRFAEAYTNAAQRWQIHYDALERVISDNPHHRDRLRRLDSLFRQRLELEERLMALRRAGAVTSAADLTASGEGPKLRAQMQALRAEIEREEIQVHHERQAAARAATARSFLILPIGSFAALALLLGALFYLNTEMTERRAAEQAARESEKRERALFEQAAVGVAQVETASGRFVRINQRYCDIVGYSADEMLGLTLQVLTHPEDLGLELNYMKRLVGGEIRECTMPERYLRKDGRVVWVNLTVSAMWAPGQSPNYHVAVAEDITERRKAEQELQTIEWLLKKAPAAHGLAHAPYTPPYSDVTALNTAGEIRQAVGEPMLRDIVSDYLELLDTSAAVYEKNGDYALGIFSSGWCRFMDQSSWKLCETSDVREGLRCGKWHCHESCWSEHSKPSIENARAVDLPCQGGIHIYAVPIQTGDEIIGSINFGYGQPPEDPARLQELAQKYGTSVEDMQRHAASYLRRPPFIIELAKKRLHASARLIGEIVQRKRAEKELRQRNRDLEEFNDLTVGRELRMLELKQEINALARQLGRPEPYELELAAPQADLLSLKSPPSSANPPTPRA